jgi:hypothetical protein
MNPLLLDAEALYADLLSGVRRLLQPDMALVVDAHSNLLVKVK